MSIWNDGVIVREVSDHELGSLVGKCCPKCCELTPRSDPNTFCCRCGVQLEWCDADGRYTRTPFGPAVTSQTDAH